MSTLSEFMERAARPVKRPAKSPGRSSSPRPVVVLKGWVKGMDKGAVTLCLRQNGASLRDAFAATNQLLEDKTVEVRLAATANLGKVRRSLEELGVILGK